RRPGDRLRRRRRPRRRSQPRTITEQTQEFFVCFTAPYAVKEPKTLMALAGPLSRMRIRPHCVAGRPLHVVARPILIAEILVDPHTGDQVPVRCPPTTGGSSSMCFVTATCSGTGMGYSEEKHAVQNFSPGTSVASTIPSRDR